MPNRQEPNTAQPSWGWWPPQWNSPPFNVWNNPLAPPSLTQPILPGWTFGNIIAITEKNSRAPETEQAIVSEHSYGRQLGQLMEAVVALIEERPRSAPEQPAFDNLIQLNDQIAHIKRETLVNRVERLERDLTQLRKESPESLRRIARLLKILEREANLTGK